MPGVKAGESVGVLEMGVEGSEKGYWGDENVIVGDEDGV